MLARLSVPRRHQILGLLLVAFGILVAIALLTLPGGERGRLATGLPGDACGVLGHHLARLLAAGLGLLPALLVPAALVIWGVNRVLLKSPAALLARSLAVAALVFFLLGLLGLSRPDDPGWVGALGEGLAVTGTELLGAVGAHVIMWVGLLVALLALLDLGLAEILVALGIAWHGSLAKLRLWGEAFNTHARTEQARMREREVARRESAAGTELDRGAPPPPATPAKTAGEGATEAGAQGGSVLAGAFDLRRTRRAERERLAAAMISDSRPPRVASPEELAGHPGMDAQAPVAAVAPPAPREGGEEEKGAQVAARSSKEASAGTREGGTAETESSTIAGREARTSAGVEAGGGAASGAAGAGASVTTTAPATGGAPPRAGDRAVGIGTRPSPPARRPSPPSGPPTVPDDRPRPRGREYVLPELGLFDPAPAGGQRIPESEILKNSRLLEQTLSHFDITGKVTEVIPGPVITRYAFEPAPGVKINQILSRTDDLALALRSHRLRILAPIPGKGAVGIEVPNHHPETVRLRDVVGVDLFSRRGGLLLALGKDVSGVPVIADLKKMPHLLIAGATGSGKSVCVNAIVVSLLCRKAPDDLRLVMIDPKMLELTSYNGIPHLLMPVVTEARMAAKALRFLVAEMLRRYERLARRGVRDIEAYNASLTKHAGLTPEVPADESELPYIVVVIDELADLMLTLGNEIEDPIARLAQMARAVGIHLVLATQRPSVDVITGMIKANFPSRIAFQVASKVDSRTILDQNGAEALLGRGDMLYQPAGRPDPVRIHGAFVSDQEIQRVVDHWDDFEPPSPALDPERLATTNLDGAEAGESEEDELFADARRIVVQTGIGSTSLLQRRLKVGYARAGRLMDLLEQSGVVGPPDGSKAREVLMRPGDLPD